MSICLLFKYSMIFIAAVFYFTASTWIIVTASGCQLICPVTAPPSSLSPEIRMVIQSEVVAFCLFI